MNARTFRNILLVDEDPVATGPLAKMLLEQELISTTVVHVNSVESMRHLAEYNFDIMVVDPYLKGGKEIRVSNKILGFIQEIKEVAPSIPIVVLTEVNDDWTASQALRDGVQDYLIKGDIDSHDLARALNYAIERKLLQDELFSEKERAQVTLNCIGDAVACSDTDGNITFLNPVAEGLTGWLLLEALGRPMRDVFRILKSEDHIAIPDPMNLALRLDRAVHLPEGSVLVRRDEVEIPVEDTAAPIHDRSGRPIGAVMVLRDVSAARAATLRLANSAAEVAKQYAIVKRVNADLSAVVQSSPVAIYATDPQGVVTMWSPAAERMSGFSRLDALGKFLPIVPVNETNFAKEIIRKVCEGERVSNVQLSHVRKDGSAIELSVSAGPLVDEYGRPRGAIAIAEDVTEAQSARRKIEQMQSEFVSTVSHELRTPLTSIAGALGLIVGTSAGALDPQMGRLVRIAYENTQRPSRLVNDILDIERLQSGRVEFRFVPTLLRDLVNQGVVANISYAEKFGVDLCHVGERSDAFVSADPDRVEQAITNLIANAVKFSPKGARVEVSTKRSQFGAQVSIHDCGPGIAEEYHSKIFQRFWRGDSSNDRKAGGSGLGLSIVREIMERHGGLVSVESALGVGSTFHLQFPVLPTDSEEAPEPTSGEQPKPILVYGFDLADSDQICASLRADGFECIAAFNREEASVAVPDGAAEAAIIRLPLLGEDLGELVSSLRRDRKIDNFPIMLMIIERVDLHGFQGLQTYPLVEWATGLERAKNVPKRVEYSRLGPLSGGTAVLYIGNRPAVLGALRRALAVEFKVVVAGTIERALRFLARTSFELVIVDFGLDVSLSKELIPAVVAASPLPILIVSWVRRDTFYDRSRVNSGKARARSGTQLRILVEAVQWALSTAGRRDTGTSGADHETQSTLR